MRRFSVCALSFGAAAFVAVPVSDGVAGSVALASGSAVERSGPLFDTAAEVPAPEQVCAGSPWSRRLVTHPHLKVVSAWFGWKLGDV